MKINNDDLEIFPFGRFIYDALKGRIENYEK